MNQLQVIVHANRRVLTTEQLAEVYETGVKNIQMNFANNKEWFEEGKHFIVLKGDALKQFKNEPNMSGLVGKNASSLYLWTERALTESVNKK